MTGLIAYDAQVSIVHAFVDIHSTKRFENCSRSPTDISDFSEEQYCWQHFRNNLTK